MVAVHTTGEVGPRSGAAAQEIALAEDLAVAGRREEAYGHLRVAVRALQGASAPADELDRLRPEHAEAREQSHRDSLTASYNRRYLDERLVALAFRGVRTGLVRLAGPAGGRRVIPQATRVPRPARDRRGSPP